MRHAWFGVAAALALASLMWSAYGFSALSTSFQSESFNRALDAARADKLGYAVAGLERVLFYHPGDAQARALLRQTRQRLHEQLSSEHREISENHGTALENLGAIASPAAWDAILLASLCVMFCAFATALRLPSSNLRTGLFSLGFLLLATASTSTLGWLGKHHWLSPGSPSIITGKDIELQENPDSRAQTSSVLLEGERVWVTNRYPSYAQVKRGDGTSGWVLESAVQTISVKD